jgi:serine protease AprX
MGFENRWLRSVLPAALAVTVLSAGQAVAARPSPRLPVVVQAESGTSAARAVHEAGGRVVRSLELVDGVAAELSDLERAKLVGLGVSVVPDIPLRASSVTFDPATADVQLAAINPGPTWTPGAGAGVGVALVDTGVAAAPDLAGRVVAGPDFTDEGDGLDHHGHGTFMAGLIAGDGTAGGGGAVRHFGVAPGAHVVSVKVAGRDGGTSLSRVLAAIDWVVEHAEEHAIGVLNLSFGADVPVAWPADPLSMAVEAAWASGITVVAAAGNGGAGSVTSPGRDPWIITAGATDTHGTAATGDDTVPSWSGRARLGRFQKPDLVAPGVSVVSLRAPGSATDEANPSARMGEHYFRGSGTSMAAALTAGTAAVLLSDRPLATPDHVKGALVAAADPIGGSSAGALDLAGAVASEPRPEWWQSHPLSGTPGDPDVRTPWDVHENWSAHWDSVRWSSVRWSSVRWSSVRWSSVRWSSVRWSSVRWSAVGTLGIPAGPT